jgi:hypothetical protein
LVVVVLLSALFFNELGKDASYVEFHNGFGIRAVSGTTLGYGLLWTALLSAIAILWTHQHLKTFHPKGAPQ